MANHRNNNRDFTTPCCRFVWDMHEYELGPVVWNLAKRAPVCRECGREFVPRTPSCNGGGGTIERIYVMKRSVAVELGYCQA